MPTALSSAYFKNADNCAAIARDTGLENVRAQQLDAEKAWRVLGDRAFETEQKAERRSGRSVPRDTTEEEPARGTGLLHEARS